MSELTQPYAWVLEKLTLSIRSDWANPPYIHDLRRVLEELNEVDPDLLAGPLMRFCTDSTCLSPLEFKGKGPWWLNKYPRIAVALPPRFRPFTDEEREEQAEVNRRGLEKLRLAAAAALAHRNQPDDQETESL